MAYRGCSWAAFLFRCMRAAVPLACTLPLACQPTDNSSGHSSPPAASHAATASAPPSQTPIEQQHETIATAYRLKPDQRFLTAFSTVQAVLTGEPRAETKATFAQGSWNLVDGNVPIGTLPEVPSYADAEQLLARWTDEILAKHPLTDPTTPPAAAWSLMTVDDALPALEQAQRDWSSGKRSAVVVARAERALVSLAEMLTDSMQMADEIGGRALALLAIAKAAGIATADDEALHAKTLGYTRAALDKARALPEGSTARAFVLHDDATLERIASGPSAGEAVRTLFLRRLDYGRQWREEEAWVAGKLASSVYTLPVAFARLITPDFSHERSITFAMPQLVLLATLRRTGDARAEAVAGDLSRMTDPDAFPAAAEKIRAGLGVTDAQTLDAFEAALGHVGAGLAGSILDAPTEQSYFRASMYAGLYGALAHAVYTWSALTATKDYVARWGTGGGAPAADFRLYADAIIDSRSGRRAPTELLSTMKDLPSFGATAPARLFHELIRQADWGDTRLVAASRVLASRMDSRCAHRSTLAYVAHYGLRDLVTMESVGRALLADAGPYTDAEQGNIAWLLRDAGWFKAQLADPSLQPSAAASVVVSLEGLGAMTDAAARAELQRRVTLAGSDWGTRQTAIDYLDKKGARPEARALAQDWLAKNGDKPGLEPVAAATRVADTYYEEKDYAAAWKTIAPIVSSQYGSAMYRASLTLDALGRSDAAEDIARQQFERYKSVSTLSQLAELYWRHGKDAEAAKLLVPLGVPMSQLDFRNIVGPAFARAFEKRPRPDAVAAIHMFDGVGPRMLRELGYALNSAGQHDLAFEIEEPLSAPGMENLEYLLASYGILQDAKGHDVAVAWLRPRVQPKLLEPLSQFAVGRGFYSLLWEVVPSPDPGRHDDFADSVWLFRAAAVARGNAEEHRAEVMAHYAGPPGGRYDRIARYVLGVGSRSDILALAAKPHDACEVAYWLGLGAQMAKHYAEASDWYRTSVETGLPAVWEYQQSFNQLSAWADGWKALSLLEAGK